jgi:predicted cupin superfamily sugar epimerase
MTAEKLITLLNLSPHEMEGGHYRETYRSPLQLPASALGPAYSSSRSAGTAIYYLLTPTTFSEMHRLPGDEVFHFYLGDAVEMLQLDDSGGRIVTLGQDVASGQQLQVVVRGGVWQGSRLKPGGDFALLGCTVAPGFDFADYERGERAALIGLFPAFSERITLLTRDH